MILDNYIIRIYRRDAQNPRLIVGIVEKVETKEKKGFTNFDELREILVPPGGRLIRRKKGLAQKEKQ